MVLQGCSDRFGWGRKIAEGEFLFVSGAINKCSILWMACLALETHGMR